MRTKEIISDKEAKWRIGKTKSELRRHLTCNHNFGVTCGIRPPRAERHKRLLDILEENTYTTKELHTIFPDISNKILRIDLIYLETQGKISAKRKPNLVIWRLKESND